MWQQGVAASVAAVMAVAGVVGVVAVRGALGDTPKNTEVVPPPHDLSESRGTLNQHHYPAHPRGSVLESLIALHLEEDEGVDIAGATPPTSTTGTTRTPQDPDTGVDILKEVRPALQTILRNLQSGSDDLGAPEGTKPTQGSGSIEASLAGGHRPSMLGVLDGFGLNSWGHFRDVAQGYLNLLQQEYEAQDSETRLPLNLLRSLLQAGDQVHLLKSFGEKLNPDLLGFLQGGIGPLLSPVVEAGRAAGVTPAVGDAVTRVARAALHHFIDHVLWVTRKDVTEKDLQDFRDNLKLRIPLVAEGLDILLARNITEGPRAYGGYPLGGVSYGEYGSPDGYGGYGGHGGYGGGSYGYGGHGYGLYLDPYLVLASIGAAALLAYLGFKVILAKTTAMRRLRRDDQLDDSDLPRGFVDTPEYDLKGSLRFTEELDDLAGALNGLWVERQRHDDPACVSCWMTTFAARHDSARPPLVPLVVSLLAHLLGAPRSGQLMDQATLQVLEGRPVTCPHLHHTCDLP